MYMLSTIFILLHVIVSVHALKIPDDTVLNMALADNEMNIPFQLDQKYAMELFTAHQKSKLLPKPSLRTFSSLPQSLNLCEHCCALPTEDDNEDYLSDEETVHLSSIKSTQSYWAQCSQDVLLCYQISEYADQEAMSIPCTDMGPVLRKTKQDRKLSLRIDARSWWKNGQVCFQASTSYSNAQTNLILGRMLEIENLTNIRFIPLQTCRAMTASGELLADTCGGCKDYVVIMPSDNPGCFSNVGQTGGPQFLVLNFDCFNPYSFHVPVAEGGVVLHELGHTLGLFHEHQHASRDILVLWKNIPSASYPNYLPLDATFVENNQEGEYDSASIMHYAEYYPNVPQNDSPRVLCRKLPTCSATSGEKCLKQSVSFCTPENVDAGKCTIPTEAFCDNTDKFLGQQVAFSAGDIEAFREMYPEMPQASRLPPLFDSASSELLMSLYVVMMWMLCFYGM